MIHVIGLLARAGHGKTTVANYLRDEYGVEIVSLASPLKKIAKVVFDFSDDQLYGTQAQKEAIDPRYGFSARIALQKLGTEGIRAHLGAETFCEGLALAVRRKYEALSERPPQGPRGANDAGPSMVCAVDDMRFPNEAEFVAELDRRESRRDGAPKMFGHVLKIVCLDAPPSGNDAHASEAGIDLVEPRHIDATIVSRRNPVKEDAHGNLTGGGFGVEHLLGEVRATLALPRFSELRRSLEESRARRRAAKAA